MKIAPQEACPCGSGKLFKDCHGPRVRQPRELKIERRLPLTVIPEPDPNTRSVFQLSGAGTVFIRGTDGVDTLVCGQCGADLAIGIDASQVRGIVFQCNDCKSFNDTPQGLAIHPAVPPTRLGNEVSGHLRLHHPRQLLPKGQQFGYTKNHSLLGLTFWSPSSGLPVAKARSTAARARSSLDGIRWV